LKHVFDQVVYLLTTTKKRKQSVSKLYQQNPIKLKQPADVYVNSIYRQQNGNAQQQAITRKPAF
jgi:hypothetical protein